MGLYLQKIFSIPTDSLLLVFLHYSHHLLDFCAFDKVPDASKNIHFKQDFLENLQAVFNHLVDLTESICQAIDSTKAAMATFDSSGIDAWVTENNPSMPMYAINSSVQKSNGKRILLQENITMFVNVRLSAHLHHVEEWYTFTLKKTYVLIPALCAGLRNGTIHIRSEPL